jgi:hypothetical protein
MNRMVSWAVFKLFIISTFCIGNARATPMRMSKFWKLFLDALILAGTCPGCYF